MQSPLPGRAAQLKMAAYKARFSVLPSQNARLAAVLILLYPKSKWHTVFIQRVSNKSKDRHSGQMSFPGGKFEESDRTLSYAALREAEEEIGIDASKVNLLGPLTDLYIPVSNFLVHPFVGTIDYTPEFKPEASEVSKIVEAPLSLLQDSETRAFKNIQVSPELTLPNVPYFNVHGHVVWGATAMILNEFLELLEQ